MRGLTDEERDFLTCSPGTVHSSLRHLLPLVSRGLVSYEHHGDSATYEITPLAGLALRLDTAARALGMVTA
jgi:hypothetical protein